MKLLSRQFKMESKYYTPTIEEFHVGFEFESNYVLFAKNKKGDEWSRCVMTGDEFSWFHEAYTNDAVESEFRVKYLDELDIWHCGFNIDIARDYQKNELILCETDGSIIKDYYQIVYKISNHQTQIFGVGDELLFNGKIKNKSELRALMKQLEIL